MNLEEYKKNPHHPVTLRTVTFITREDEVLLGLKKRGFGSGIYVGIGGKLEDDESPEQAAVREIEEEIGCLATNLIYVGLVTFYFPHIDKNGWNQKGYIFTTTEFEREPQETEEIKPAWFKKTELPLDQMWDDAKYWLPKILNGHVIDDEFSYGEDLRVAEHKVNSSR